MFHKEVSSRQMAAWLLTAMSAPLIRLAGQSGWLAVLLGGSVSALLCRVVNGLDWDALTERKWFCTIQIIWLTVITAQLGYWSADVWQTGGDFPVVPVTLLTLAVFSALNGACGASRGSGILFWLAAFLYTVVFAAGIEDISPERLDDPVQVPSQRLLLALLLPAAVGFLPREKGAGMGWTFPVIGLFAAAAEIWTVGILSASVAKGVEWAFYEASKSVKLFGSAKRLEAMVAVAMTMGYFSLYSLLLSGVGCLTERLHGGWGKAGVIGSGIAAGILLFAPAIGYSWLIGITLILWFVLPFALEWLRNKKTKKIEKRA